MSGLSSYGTRHLQALFGAVGRLARAPLATLLTLIVIGVALALPAGLAILVNNVRLATGDLRNANDFTVHFKIGTPIERVNQLAASVRERGGVEKVTVTNAEAALEEFKRTSTFGEALEALEKNPLPHHLVVRPAENASNPNDIESLRRYFQAWPEVDIVQLDIDWVKRLHALYTGVFYGLGGALLAALLVASGMAYLDQAVTTLSRQYGGSFALTGLGLEGFGLLAGLGAVLGWLGALISTGRHLRQIEPRA
jgi:cell division transport system permease protein